MYWMDVPVVPLSEPAPVSVQVGVAVLPVTTAVSVIAAPPGATVVAEGVTVSEVAGEGLGDGVGVCAGAGEPPPPPHATSARGIAATAA
jgi:hypothetical protein